MDHEENEPKLFSLMEAERARRELEPVLIEAMENRRKLAELDEQLSAVANRILIWPAGFPGNPQERRSVSMLAAGRGSYPFLPPPG